MSYEVQLHTHTWRCQHAEGDVVAYARIAAAGGCRVLGISDHMPHPDGRWADVRMGIADLDAYEAAVALASREVPDLEIVLGMECEYLPELDTFYEDELKGRRGYRYLIGAGHYIEVDGRWRGAFENAKTPAGLRAYASILERTMASGHFAFIAHPDCVGAGIDAMSPDVEACFHDICAAAVATGTPLELNAYGLRKGWKDTAEGRRPGYPWDPFWAIAAEAGVRVVRSSDAHRPQDVLHGHAELGAIIARHGLVEVDALTLVQPCTGDSVSQDAPPQAPIV